MTQGEIPHVRSINTPQTIIQILRIFRVQILMLNPIHSKAQIQTLIHILPSQNSMVSVIQIKCHITITMPKPTTPHQLMMNTVSQATSSYPQITTQSQPEQPPVQHHPCLTNQMLLLIFTSPMCQIIPVSMKALQYLKTLYQ